MQYFLCTKRTRQKILSHLNYKTLSPGLFRTSLPKRRERKKKKPFSALPVRTMSVTFTGPCVYTQPGRSLWCRLRVVEPNAAKASHPVASVTLHFFAALSPLLAVTIGKATLAPIKLKPKGNKDDELVEGDRRWSAAAAPMQAQKRKLPWQEPEPFAEKSAPRSER